MVREPVQEHRRQAMERGRADTARRDRRLGRPVKTLGPGVSNALPAPPAGCAGARARRGRGALGLFLALVLACGATLLFLRHGADPARGSAAAPAAGPSATGPSSGAPERVPAASTDGAAHAHVREPADREGSDPRASVPEPDLGTPSGAPDPREFEGFATLRGTVEVFGDQPPATWTLSLRPSTTLFGREHAEPRELVFPGDRLDFVVERLPLGGYDVQAVAEGRNGRALPILLTRTNHESFVVLELSPASFLEGTLLDEQEGPLEGLAVALVAPDGTPLHTTVSDASGRYRFDGVRDGAWKLVVGDPANPLLPPRSLRLVHPGMRFPDVVLAGLGTLDVFVLDEDGLFLAGAPVRGSGTRGGVLEGTTDHDGRIVFRNLVSGRYRLRAEHPLQPERTSLRAAVELAPGTTERIELRFRP